LFFTPIQYRPGPRSTLKGVPAFDIGAVALALHSLAVDEPFALAVAAVFAAAPVAAGRIARAVSHQDPEVSRHAGHLP
jgi:hypothetical protein